MGFFDFLKSDPGPADVGLEGKDLHAGRPRTNARRARRNEARILRLRLMLTRETDPQRQASIKAELNRRLV